MKRAFALLLAFCMVITMLPAVQLPAFAAEEAGQEELVYGSANLDGVDAAIIEQMNAGNAIDNSDEAFAQHLANKTCPICGDISGMEGASDSG